MIFPGGVAVSVVRVYDWPTADGLCGGSPHMHLLCTEAYVVVEGSGAVQTLTVSGYAENPLTAGDVVWFPPGTVHRLLNYDGRLRVMVIMQNGGLPEAGDAVFTFPAAVLADPAAYRASAAGDDQARARSRRDLAVEGFLELRSQGAEAVAGFHRTALRLLVPLLDGLAERWRTTALAAAVETGDHLDNLRQGDVSHLRTARIVRAGSQARLGMCGHLDTYRTMPGGGGDQAPSAHPQARPPR